MMLPKTIKWWRCTGLVAASVLSACAASPSPSVIAQSVDFSSCESLAGDFDANGTDTTNGRLISYKTAARMPKSDAAQVLRISFDRANLRLVVQQLSSDNIEVAPQQRLRGECVNGHWILRDEYHVRVDGTRIDGVDVWDFQRASDGHLLFRVNSQGTSMPFVTSRPYRDDTSARFAPIRR